MGSNRVPDIFHGSVNETSTSKSTVHPGLTKAMRLCLSRAMQVAQSKIGAVLRTSLLWKNLTISKRCAKDVVAEA